MNETDIEVTEEQYDDHLNEIYPPVKLGNLVFDPARIIKELDPIAYRCGKADYEDYLSRY